MSFVENQFVNFKIITRNSKGNPYRWWMLGIVVCVMTFVLIYDEPKPKYLTLAAAIVMVASLLVGGIKMQLIEEHDEIGWLMMAAEYLIVKVGSDEFEYALDKTTTLTFELRGYAGEPVIGEMIAQKKGYDNFVSLTSANETKRYEILISNRMKISIMERLLGHYRRRGVVVRYVDKSFDDSRVSLIGRLLMAFRGAR